MVSYEINPSSGPVVVQKVLDIRPVAYNEAGNVKSGYKLPDELKGRRFVRQIGLVPKGSGAYVYVQPSGTYTPDFGYGPITCRAVVHKQRVELKGRYDKFPDLPRYKEVFVREIIEDGMRCVGLDVFDVLNSYAGSQVTEENINDLMESPDFCKALIAVFETVGFKTSFAVPQ